MNRTRRAATARRLVIALALALSGVFLVATPASAQQDSIHCRTWIPNGYTTKLCLETWWRNDAGPHGMTVFEMDAYITGSEWQSFGCASFLLKNDSGTVKWQVNGSTCNITNQMSVISFQPQFPNGIDMTTTDSFTVQITGYPHFEGAGDPGQQTVGVTYNDS